MIVACKETALNIFHLDIDNIYGAMCASLFRQLFARPTLARILAHRLGKAALLASVTLNAHVRSRPQHL